MDELHHNYGPEARYAIEAEAALSSTEETVALHLGGLLQSSVQRAP